MKNIKKQISVKSMNLHNLNPFVRFAKRFTSFIPLNTQSVCYDARLFYFKSGSGFLTIDGEKYKITNNTTIFLPSNTKYKFEVNNLAKADTFCINFDLTDEFSDCEKALGTATNSTFLPEKVKNTTKIAEFSCPFIVYEVSSIEYNLIKCCHEFLNKQPYYRERCSAMIKACLIDILRHNNYKKNNLLVAEINDFICKNYADATLSNESLAKRFNYHPFYLSKLFKETTGKTLHQTIIFHKIKEAKNLLITSNCSVDIISWKTGFNSVSHFIKTFKTIEGVTPNKFRKLRQITTL